MSLIHKALKKVEGKEKGDNSQPKMPEEGVVAEEEKKNFPPRTIVLIVLVALAGSFAVYTNFFANKKKSAPKPAPFSKPAPQAEQPKPDKVEMADVNIVKKTSAKDYEMSDEAKALFNQGEQLFEKGSFDIALARFKEALILAPKSAQILNSMGLVFKRKGEPERAEKYYVRAIQSDPKCAECLNNLGVLEVSRGDYVNAVMRFKKAVEASETYADPYFNLGVVMEKEGNFKSAVENYKKFLMYTSTNDENLKKMIRTRIEDLVLNWQN